MIQPFTISFDFEGKTHLGLASIKTDIDEDNTYSIRLYSISLHRIFPDGVLKYSGSELTNFTRSKHPQAEPLFRCIHQSVRAHLKLAQPY